MLSHLDNTVCKIDKIVIHSCFSLLKFSNALGENYYVYEDVAVSSKEQNQGGNGLIGVRESNLLEYKLSKILKMLQIIFE